MATKNSDATLLWTFLTVVSCGFCWFWGYESKHPEITYENPVIVKDSLIIDSIFVKNDSIETKIVYVKNDYTEKVNTIINSTDSSNYVFFTNYIYNYSGSIKNN